jgi:Beta-galactosidase C-terminal domain
LRHCTCRVGDAARSRPALDVLNRLRVLRSADLGRLAELSITATLRRPRGTRDTAQVPAHAGGVDLLSGDRVVRGERLSLDPYGVVVLREDAGG